LLLAGVACGGAGAAAAQVVFDFEELPPTSLPSLGSGALSSLVSERNGMTLTVFRSAGGKFDLAVIGGDVYPAAWGNRTLDPFVLEAIDDWFVGTFSAPVTRVTLQATDFADDQDELRLAAYTGPEATGDFVDEALEFWPLTSSSPDFTSVTVTADAEPIWSIRFRGGSPTAFPNSMFVDNVSVTPAPEPAAGALGAAALLALGRVHPGGVRRRSGAG
jgi:hypothetical protein